jgi:glycerate 2-kinase
MNPVDDAIAIWTAGVAAVEPRRLVREALEHLRRQDDGVFPVGRSVIVVGAGKAGAAMAAGVEDAFADDIGRVRGIVNVPEGATLPLKKIELHPARPAGSNSPTEEGVAGAHRMLRLLSMAERFDLAIGVFSGGGSALLPAPTIPLADKQEITRLLAAAGATIQDLNCVRKHLSLVKGGRLTDGFPGRRFHSLLISDVIGDSPDVIASGPTSADPTTFDDALVVLQRFDLMSTAPASAIDYLNAGAAGRQPETLKQPWSHVVNHVIGSNAIALDAALHEARRQGQPAISLGSSVAGNVALATAMVCTTVRTAPRPNAILFGGETTVVLGPNPGKGGRNQEFVLAMLCELGEAGMDGVTILCAGTDGEDGPTDAAGAIGTTDTFKRAKALGLDPHDYLKRHDAYHFFDAVGGLFKTGLTGTNVMDLGTILLR